MLRKGSAEGEAITYLLLFAFIVVCLGAGVIVTLATQETITVTVTEKERVRSGSSDKYLVWVQRSDGVDETLENVDCILFMKFRSSDLYAQLQPGQRYEMKVAGLRIGILSQYRNIIDARPL